MDGWIDGWREGGGGGGKILGEGDGSSAGGMGA